MTRKFPELERLYAQEVKYYLHTMSGSEVIQSKKKYLYTHPNFNQSITGEIVVTSLGNNTYQVRFPKRTNLKSKTVDVEAELIFIQEAGEWKIQSEQDAYTTDLSEDKQANENNSTVPYNEDVPKSYFSEDNLSNEDKTKQDSTESYNQKVPESDLSEVNFSNGNKNKKKSKRTKEIPEVSPRAVYRP